MSSLPKKMGEDDSATNVGNSGLFLFNAYQKKNFGPFLEDMTEWYAQEDNIKFLLTDYIKFISTTDIPKYFDEEIKS